MFVVASADVLCGKHVTSSLFVSALHLLQLLGAAAPVYSISELFYRMLPNRRLVGMVRTNV